ncbi:MAG TPA: nucleotidyltransferase domain-containing protein [Myxococcota bacterium]|nr:nucleotidyltransferase domain-containing protein [Myxococcota bacterium]
MRLTKEEIASIKKAIGKFVQPSNFQLFLFGSRIDASKKGGDIDLLLVVDKSFFDIVVPEKHKMLAEIKDVIGDQKIDLIIATPQDLKEEPFLETIQKSAVRI